MVSSHPKSRCNALVSPLRRTYSTALPSGRVVGLYKGKRPNSDVRNGREVVTEMTAKYQQNPRQIPRRDVQNAFLWAKICVYQKKSVILQRKIEIDGTVIMEAVIYKTEEERMEALRRMVGLRKVFEARVREIMAKNEGIAYA